MEKIAILSDGLLQLCQNDSTVDELISPRREEILRLLTKYIAEIELFNPTLGLVGTGDRQELIVKHILDSLAPLAALSRCVQRLFKRQLSDNCQTVADCMRGHEVSETNTLPKQQSKIVDIGSGAGLPGIPLAIVLSKLEFTLIERMGRRAGFLRNTQAALGLSNVSVEEAEMEKAEPGRFALVTFRAFRPLEPPIVKSLFRLCADGGVLAAYKGRREKIEEEMAALEKIRPELRGHWKYTPCPVPGLNEERHLLTICLS